jgi:N-acylneuraminate cytidylyltransferase/CMP-N,N'-diacetyllegionaminic acid synthase
MALLCTICARGGSKGIPGKNILPLLGKPLIVHSIDQARASGLFTAVAVSSDSGEILDVAREFGADLLIERPAELATDAAGKLPAIRHAILAAEAALDRRFEISVDLDCTAPLRLPADITGAVDLLVASGAACVVTGTPARKSPSFNLVEVDPSGGVAVAKPLDPPPLRRQDAPRCYDMNASIYVWRRDPFIARPFVLGPDTRLFVMPRERSLDIDEPLDFEIVEMLMRRAARASPETSR